MTDMPGTLTKLIADLKALPETPARDGILLKAVNGHYHDFQSKVACPKMQLREDLVEARLHDLAQKVVEGEYDEA